jgi:hypothetical protein
MNYKNIAAGLAASLASIVAYGQDKVVFPESMNDELVQYTVNNAIATSYQGKLAAADKHGMYFNNIDINNDGIGDSYLMEFAEGKPELAVLLSGRVNGQEQHKHQRFSLDLLDEKITKNARVQTFFDDANGDGLKDLQVLFEYPGGHQYFIAYQNNNGFGQLHPITYDSVKK